MPTLFSVSSLGEANRDPVAYGKVLPFIVEYGDVVQIVVNNLDGAIHPFHLHGHQFQVLDRPRSGEGKWSGNTNTAPSAPPRRDTITVYPNSFAVLRIVADNPGVFLFHCHIEWHVEMGLTATLIEAPEKLRNLPIPRDHLDNCKAMGIPTAGNAGGNVDDPRNTSNMNLEPPLVYAGYVALFYITKISIADWGL